MVDKAKEIVKEGVVNYSGGNKKDVEMYENIHCVRKWSIEGIDDEITIKYMNVEASINLREVKKNIKSVKAALNALEAMASDLKEVLK